MPQEYGRRFWSKFKRGTTVDVWHNKPSIEIYDTFIHFIKTFISFDIRFIIFINTFIHFINTFINFDKRVFQTLQRINEMDTRIINFDDRFISSNNYSLTSLEFWSQLPPIVLRTKRIYTHRRAVTREFRKNSRSKLFGDDLLDHESQIWKHFYCSNRRKKPEKTDQTQ